MAKVSVDLHVKPKQCQNVVNVSEVRNRKYGYYLPQGTSCGSDFQQLTSALLRNLMHDGYALVGPARINTRLRADTEQLRAYKG